MDKLQEVSLPLNDFVAFTATGNNAAPLEVMMDKCSVTFSVSETLKVHRLLSAIVKTLPKSKTQKGRR